MQGPELRENFGGAASSVAEMEHRELGVQVLGLQERRPVKWVEARSCGSGEPRGGAWTAS